MQGAGQPQPGYGYGSAHGPHAGAPDAPQKHYQKRRVGLIVLLICFALPVLNFMMVGAVLSFKLRYYSPGLSWVFVALGGVFTLICSLTAVDVVSKRARGEPHREPYWYVFLSVTMAAAWFFAIWLGQVNWTNYMEPYLAIQKLGFRSGLDPSRVDGLHLEGVGQIVFSNSTKLDLTRALGFKNVDQYCVAPIKSSPRDDVVHDVWAVGLNCCSGGASAAHTWRCGEYADEAAHGGVRVVGEDQLSSYRLAVEQAAATYHIRTKRPVFFYWMRDPAAFVETYPDGASWAYWLGVVAFFFAQLYITFMAVFFYGDSLGLRRRCCG